MPNRGLAMARGGAQGLEKAMMNIYNIKMAGEQLRMKKEGHDTDMKIKKLQLKKAEHSLSPEILALETEKLKTANAAAKQAFNLQGLTLKEAEMKARDRLKTEGIKQNILDRYNQSLEPGGSPFEVPAGLEVDYGAGVKFKKPTVKQSYTRAQVRSTAENLAMNRTDAQGKSTGSPFRKPSFKEVQAQMDNAERLLSGQAQADYQSEQRDQTINQAYGQESAQQIIGVIQSLKEQGKSAKEIRKFMDAEKIDSSLFEDYIR